MATATNVDRIRQAALESADQNERNFFRFIWAVAFLELLIAIVYVSMAVFGFSVPVLIGVAGVCVYTMAAAGLYGLKLHIGLKSPFFLYILFFYSCVDLFKKVPAGQSTEQ